VLFSYHADLKVSATGRTPWDCSGLAPPRFGLSPANEAGEKTSARHGHRQSPIGNNKKGAARNQYHDVCGFGKPFATDVTDAEPLGVCPGF